MSVTCKECVCFPVCDECVFRSFNAERCRNFTRKQRWIPVSERLPEKGKDVVITALRWGEVDVGWCEDGVWGSEFVNKYECGEVTHWMPLPEPPKEGE